MGKPTDTYDWATDPNATLEPDAGSKASGFVANDKPPARWHNWLFNGAGQWHEYLNNLHAESEFLNKAYTWLGAHGFASTLRLHGAANEIEYANAAGVVTPRARMLMLPLTQFVPSSYGAGTTPQAWVDTWGFVPGTSPYWLNTNRAAGELVCSFQLPTGALITNIRFSVYATAGNITAKWGVYSPFPGGSEAAATTAFQFSETKVVTSTNVYDCLPAAGNVPISASGSTPYFSIQSDTTGHWLRWARVYFTDPGPRNF